MTFSPTEPPDRTQGTPAKKAKPKSQRTKKAKEVRKEPRERTVEALERQILRNSILNPNKELARELFENMKKAEIVTAEAKDTVTKSTRLNLRKLKDYAAKIYDPTHFSWDPSTDTTTWSDAFVAHFDQEEEEQSKPPAVTPQKKKPTTAARAKIVVTNKKEADTPSDNLPSEKQHTTPASDDEEATLPSLDLPVEPEGTYKATVNYLNRMLNKNWTDDEEEKQDGTPRMDNTSIEEGFHYEPDNYLDPNRNINEKAHQNNVQNDESTLSSTESKASVDYKVLWEALKEDSEAQIILLNERVNHMETQLAEQKDMLLELRRDTLLRADKLEEVTLEQHGAIDKLTKATVNLQEKAQPQQMKKMIKRAEELRNQFGQFIDGKSKEVRHLRGSLAKDIKQLGEIHINIMDDATTITTRAVEEKADTLITERLSAAEAEIADRQNQAELAIAARKNDAMIEIENLQ